MTITSDPVALNQWLPVSYPGQIKAGAVVDTQLIGQEIRLSADSVGAVRCRLLSDDGKPGPDLPVVRRFEVDFTALGPEPRPLPEICEFDDEARRVFNCGAFGVHASPCRIVENFLDMAHFSFVHTGILGSVKRAEVLSYTVTHREDTDEIWADDCQFYQPAASKSAADAGQGLLTRYTYRILSPFSVMLYKSAAGHEDRFDAICLFIQPKSETECVCYTPMALLDEVSSAAGIIDFQQTIFLQDRIILENQRPRLLPLTPRAETPTRADLSSVVYRRWLKSSGLRFGLQHSGKERE